MKLSYSTIESMLKNINLTSYKEREKLTKWVLKPGNGLNMRKRIFLMRRIYGIRPAKKNRGK